MSEEKPRTEVEKRRAYSEVMACFHRGELRRGGTGEIVTSPVEARAIASRIAGLTKKQARRRRLHGSGRD